MSTIDLDLFRQWNERVVNLIGLTDFNYMAENILQALQVLMPSDIGMVVLYKEGEKPVNIGDNSIDIRRRQSIDTFLEGAYLLDPYYRASIRGIKSGVYCLNEVAPAGFRQSEYYKNYYKSSLIVDEVGFITHLFDGCFTNIYLVNCETSPKFMKRSIECLKLAQVVIDDSMTKYWVATKNSAKEDDSQLHSQFEAALDIFGTSILTVREREVIQLYLHGHNTKSIAAHLCISGHTVSVHRKNSYAKLDINSQMELIHLFIDSLSCLDSEMRRDPLEYYFSAKKAR